MTTCSSGASYIEFIIDQSGNGMLVLYNFSSKMWWSTLSNAFSTSKVTTINGSRVLAWLIASVTHRAAMAGALFSVKPNWSSWLGMNLLILIRMTCSRSLHRVAVMVIPLWLLMTRGSLPFFGNGIFRPNLSCLGTDPALIRVLRSVCSGLRM